MVAAIAHKFELPDPVLAGPGGDGYGLMADAINVMPNGEPDWLTAIRQTAQDSFAITGAPTPAWEMWKYTNLRPVLTAGFGVADTLLPELQPKPLACARIVIDNGVINPELSEASPRHIRVMNFAEALAVMPETLETALAAAGQFHERPFVALNAAMMRDVTVIHVTGMAEMPVMVDYRSSGHAHARTVVIVDKGASAQLVERFTSSIRTLFNLHFDVMLAADAALHHVRFQAEDKSSLHVTTTFLTQQKTSNYQTFALNTGAAVMRHEIVDNLIDPHVSCKISGIYMATGQQISDTTLRVNHFEPNGISYQKYKGVIDAEARAIFQGKIYVSRPAQKTDGYQLSHALLLSENAHAYAKPELEIYADDVKCSHGSATNKIDADALFYMRARGIDEQSARRLLIEAYLSEMLEDVPVTALRDHVAAAVSAWLDERRQGQG